jgi:hypothetical protein
MAAGKNANKLFSSSLMLLRNMLERFALANSLTWAPYCQNKLEGVSVETIFSQA